MSALMAATGGLRKAMAVFDAILHLLDALDFAGSSSRWRFFVPAVIGAAAGLAFYHYGGGSTESGVAGTAALLAGIGVGAFWHSRWKGRGPELATTSSSVTHE